MVETKLQEIRRRLLDLTRRNRLLNHQAKGQSTLEIVDELPSQVYGVLVDDARTMQFLSREEGPHSPPQPQALPANEELPPREPLTNELAPPQLDPSNSASGPDLPLAPVGASIALDRQQDRNLQTLLSGEKLQTRLVHLAREAASALQEQGYNILYLTLGVVEWREVEGQTVSSRAPLVFVPVELKRKTVNTRYAVQLFEDDVLTNPCLAELCQNQFAFDLPVFDSEEGDLNAYFAQVRKAVELVPGWSFHPEIHLGLFSFSKLLMYRDLDPRSWPDPSRLTGHPLICQLTGWVADGVAPVVETGGLADPETLDETISPVDCFQVVDADSSQQAAIVAAKRGVSMVIDGPPGTGKSQTITNIIGECLADGRTVLFVSEKAAALEVVKRRLENVGLGDFVLELHSRKTSKKSVMQELQRTLDAQPGSRKTSDQTAVELKAARDALNAYRRELHEPMGALKISPFQAISSAIALSAEPEIICEIPNVSSWTREQLTDSHTKIEALDRRLARVGEPSKHPWRGVGLKAVGLREQQAIAKSCEELSREISASLRCFAALSARLGLGAATRVCDATCQLSSAEVLLHMPLIAATAVGDSRWDVVDPRLAKWIDQGKHRAQLRATWSAAATPEAELEDWQPVLNRRQLHGHSFSRFFRPSWYSDSKLLRRFTSGGNLPRLDGQIAMLKALIESKRLRNEIERDTAIWTDQLGPAWGGIDGDWEALEQYVHAIIALRKLLAAGKLTLAAALVIVPSEDRVNLLAEHKAATEAMTKLQSAWSKWLAVIASDDKQWLGADWPSAELPALLDRLSPLPTQLEPLADWVDFHQLAGDLSNGLLASFTEFLLSPAGLGVRGRAANSFQRHFYRLWVEEAFSQRQALRAFHGQDHESLIARFGDLDRKWLEMTRHRLAARLAAHRPQHQPAHRQSKLGLLQAEFRKKTRHMPLRKVLAAAGEVVQSIKPCFMMSPMSVAQYLAPGGIEFDVVVFDEASQVEPADAYGAIARGRQLLLVGDERQLPPTDFFSRADRDDPNSDDHGDFRAADLESVLSLGIVRLQNRCGLRWHYRSRHSSLIEFSNQKFYDGALRVFPSPHTDCAEMGLAFRFIDNAVYNRGSGRHNPLEATAVARAVIQHAIDHPELSLGVGTLNQPQQKAIEDEIEHLRRSETDDRVEAFIAAHAAREPFFVKNLENIQGDERDVIFLSVGFGKDSAGKMSLNFGALNDDGGWRRLNVLVTRARRRCVVFSSIRHDDINLGNSDSRGVAALKEYLYAAEHGHLKDEPRPGKDHDSEFEAAVCRAIRDRGWEVHPQVGCAGFAIDLAVVDPRAPGRYLLGIECDGTTYHNSATARDRDRLRQAVLEGLGWKIHRVWSTDWFHRPATVLETLLKRLDALKREPLEFAAPVSPIPVPGKTSETSIDELAAPSVKAEKKDDASTDGELAPGVEFYRHQRNAAPRGAAEDLLQLLPEELSEIVKELVEIEGPIHEEEALRVLSEMYQTRVSARLREAFEVAVEREIEAGSVSRREKFLRNADAGEVKIRHRGEPCPVTKAELIAPEEFEAAVRLALRQQYGLKSEAVVDSTARLMGFTRTGTKLKAAIEGAIDRLAKRKEIKSDASEYVIIPSAD